MKHATSCKGILYLRTHPSPLADAVSRFGATLKSKLSGKGASEAPEDQLRAPLETLIVEVAGVLLFKPNEVVLKGEATLSALKCLFKNIV